MRLDRLTAPNQTRASVDIDRLPCSCTARTHAGGGRHLDGCITVTRWDALDDAIRRGRDQLEITHV